MDTPAPSGGGGGVPAVPVMFPASPNNVFTFMNVGGEVCLGGFSQPNGPDGGNFALAVESWCGISGVRGDTLGYLAGVFLGLAEPTDPAPPPLDFGVIGTNFVSIAPRIGQVFFIGDGLAETGVTQQFRAPPAASRLFLGLADTIGGDGCAGSRPPADPRTVQPGQPAGVAHLQPPTESSCRPRKET